FSSFQKHLDRGQRNLSVPAVDGEAMVLNDVHKKVFKLSKTFGPGAEEFVSTCRRWRSDGAERCSQKSFQAFKNIWTGNREICQYSGSAERCSRKSLKAFKNIRDSEQL
ncbi:MAG: hypothetical protein IKC63_08240, partial [Clostridia bacterium]|nr:hypothetical protein [Clostridia bacterium]